LALHAVPGGSGGAGSISSVSNSDGSLTISPTTGAVIASLNTAHSNNWTDRQLFTKTDVTYTPLPVSSPSLSFVADGSGFTANGTTYNYYVYGYYIVGALGDNQTAYDAVGTLFTGTDPNDANTYNISLSWTAGANCNGYWLLDFNTGLTINIGNVTSYTVTPVTGWGGTAIPSTPTDITDSISAIWSEPYLDFSVNNFTAMSFGANTTAGTYLRFRWLFSGSGGSGGLRLEDSSSNLQFINANFYGGTGQISSVISDSVSATTSLIHYGISTKRVLHMQSSVVSGDAGFEYDFTTNNLLIASASITPQSKIHIDSGTGTASAIRFTANATTGQTSSDGFEVGITSTAIAELRQRENLGLNIYTNNTLAMEITSGQLVGLGTAGTVSAKLHVISTTEQLRLGYDSSNYVTFTISSGGNLSLQTTATTAAGIFTLTPFGAGGSGTNRTLNFGNGFGNAAIFLYNNGASTRFGWGMQSDAMQFFAPTATGGIFTWNRGGELQATGTNELMRLVQYVAGTGAGLAIGGTAALSATTPYKLELECVSAAAGTAQTQDFFRVRRVLAGGVSYPDVFAIGLGRYDSSGFGPSTAVDFKLKSTATSTIETDITVLSLNSNRRIGVGVTAPEATAHFLSTTEQLRCGYDASNYFSTTVSSAGAVTLNAVGAGAQFNFSDRINLASLAGSTTDGDVWQDSTQKALQTYVNGIEQTIQGIIFTQTANTTVANTVTETTIIGTGVGTVTLPANFFVAGKTVNLEMRGYHSSVSTPTLRVRIKLGSTTILDSGAKSTGNGTNDGFRLNAMITCRATGVSGTVHGQGDYIELHTGGVTVELVSTSVVTVDTTASQAIVITVEWGTAALGNTITSTNFYAEVLN